MQAKRAARANPMSSTNNNASIALLDEGISPKSKRKDKNDALLMFGDPVDAASVMTGMSQQGLIVRNIHQLAKQRRESKKYPKPREKKKNVRILNLPASLKRNSSAGSTSRRKYQRGVSDEDPSEEQNLLGEQAPFNARQKNVLSRHIGSRRRSSDPGSATEDAVDRKGAWKLIASLTASRSGEGSNSSQNSIGTSVGASTQASKEDLLAQAAENWIKSTEETGAAQFSADEEDFVRGKTDARQVADRLDQDSFSTNGSDDERPTEEDGAFPSLKDARIRFGPDRLSFDHEPAAVSDEAQWKDVSPRSTDLFIETRNNGPFDKMSEESPVSVMAVPNRRVRRATSGSQTRTLLPPKESARRRRSRRPPSILRSGRHSGTKEVSAKIQSVKSARVKFHKEVVRGELSVKQQAHDSDEYVSSYIRSEPDDNVSTEDIPKDHTIDTVTPQDWAAFVERDTSLLSPVSEGDSLQTEPSHHSGTSDPRSGPVERVLGLSTAGDGEWPLRMRKSKPSTGRREINMFPELPDSDHEWGLDEGDRASFGTFGQFKAERAMDGGSTSEEEIHDFMETVAAIVIQTAVRRMIAIDVAQKMLIEASLEDARDLDAFSIDCSQQFGIDDASTKEQSYPLKIDQLFEASPSHDDPPSQSFIAKNEPLFEAFPKDFAQFPSSGEKVLETRSPERGKHQMPVSSKERTSETCHVQNLSTYPLPLPPPAPTTGSPQRSGEAIVERESLRQRRPVLSNPERELKGRPLTEDGESVEAATKAKRKFEILLSKYENNIKAFSSMDEPRVTTTRSIHSDNQKEEPVASDQPQKQDDVSESLASVKVQQSKSLPDNEERDLEILPPTSSPERQTTPLMAEEAALEAIPYHMYNIAAIQIQSTFRGWWVRDSVNVDHYCACRIQRAYRSFRERMSFVFDIYRIALIQSLWRRKLAKKEVDRLRRLKIQKDAEKSRRLAARREAEKVRRLAAQRDAERRQKKEAEELEAKRLRELAAQKEAEELEAKRQAELEAEERELERRRKLAELEAEKHRMLEAKWVEQEREAERLREQAAFQAAREEAEKREADRIWAERIAAAIRIQSHWRSSAARVECLNRFVSILLLQSVARKWLAKNQVSRIAQERAAQEAASTQLKPATEAQLSSKVESDTITASNDLVQAFTGKTTPDTTREIEDVAFSEAQVLLPEAEESSEEKGKDSESVYRAESEVEVDEGEYGQRWVTVSHSYDEESFVQSYATEKSATVNSESKEQAEVSKLSADELIELFIHTSVSTHKDSSRCVTPLRMESPDNLIRSAAPSATSSADTSLVDEKIHEERPKLPGRPPRKEKVENSNEILDIEVLLAKEKVDRMNARLAKNNAAVKNQNGN
jgi:hypothetical protein